MMRLYVNGQQKEDRKTESMKSIDNGKGIQVLVTAVLAAVLLWTVPGDAAGSGLDGRGGVCGGERPLGDHQAPPGQAGRPEGDQNGVRSWLLLGGRA